MKEFWLTAALWLENPLFRAAAVLLLSILVALFSGVIIRIIKRLLFSRTKTKLDDAVFDYMRAPIFITIIGMGTAYSFGIIPFSEKMDFALNAGLKTLEVIIWGYALLKIGQLVLVGINNTRRVSFIQTGTLPLFQILWNVIIVGAMIYLGMLAWNIDVTGWLASAGIAGIAIGFAAKDTLANLFAGIFILTDAPYQVGDYINLADNERGEVTHIGIRSTRILTRDMYEVTIPNNSIANSKVVNESRGRVPFQRVTATVEAAYGNDLDHVVSVLETAAKDLPNTVKTQAKTVIFRQFGSSGLVFQVRVFISDPAVRGRVIDLLNTRIYKAMNEAGIEIPYSKHDIYIKEVPKKNDLVIESDEKPRAV